MIFSRKNFESSAPNYVKKLVPESHRMALDGKQVVFEKNDRFGTVNYEADNADWTLYPVYPEWCEEENHETE